MSLATKQDLLEFEVRCAHEDAEATLRRLEQLGRDRQAAIEQYLRDREAYTRARKALDQHQQELLAPQQIPVGSE